MTLRPFGLFLRPGAWIRDLAHTDPTWAELLSRVRDLAIAALVIGTLAGLLTWLVPSVGIILLQAMLVGVIAMVSVIIIWLVGF